MEKLIITIIACTIGLVVSLQIMLTPINLKLDSINKAVITSAVVADPDYNP